MKQFFYFYILSLFLVASFVFSGCEAGLNSSDSSSEKSEIDEFSFSEMYKNIRELKITVADLQSQITASSVKETELQSQIDESKSRETEMQAQIDSLIQVSAPVGSIQAWDKNLAGTPDIPAGWVECNGQVVSDAESVYNGVAVPDLNSEGRFLRGGATSGELEEDATAVNGLGIGSGGSHAHSISQDWTVPYDYDDGFNMYHGSDYGHAYTRIGKGYTNFTWTTSTTGSHSHSLSGDSETRPTNMSVVWIMRIK